jgi:hypothetical protein
MGKRGDSSRNEWWVFQHRHQQHEPHKHHDDRWRHARNDDGEHDGWSWRDHTPRGHQGQGCPPREEPSPTSPEDPGVATYRSIDGSGNNTDNPDWGAAGSQFLRSGSAAYTDGLSAPAGPDRPDARDISNAVFSQNTSIENAAGASNLLWVWGQFLDHDIDLAAEGHGESLPIPVPAGDPWFDPFGTGTQTIPLTRSGFDPATGTIDAREQINEITAFIDASNVYGSDGPRQAFLRTDGGKLKLTADGHLPANDGTFANAGPGGDSAPLAGDVRANENVALTSMHTIFVREHNRLVDDLADKHPDWDDETLFQQAKALVEAEMQAITYNEFLPLLLGEDALPAWSGYRADVNPGIANEFAGAAYRVGHTMLSATLLRMEEDGGESTAGSLSLAQAFFNPTELKDGGGVDPLFRGLAASNAQEIDALVIDDVRNFLFGPPGAGGLDLVSLNIQRGRDHGLPSYNDARIAYGLDPVTDFGDITSDLAVQARLASVYDNVDQIDLFVGGLAEDQVAGAMVGELVHAILADQFLRLRDGDSFWYEGRFSGDALDDLQETSLAGIIMRNSDVDHLQHEALLASDRIGGDHGRDTLIGDGGRDLIIGFGGRDRLYGRGGDDDLFGDGGRDTIHGGRGDDWLWGGRGRDTLRGGRGDDRLMGEEGNDRLYGGPGDDTLIGGGGRDRMTGGDGRDTFRFGTDDLPGGADRITDFEAGADGDILDLSDLLPEAAQTDLDDYVSLRSRGGDTAVRVDVDGSGRGGSEILVVLDNVAGLSLNQLINDGNIVV